ncbi:hypothetical protein [Sphingomonas sp. 2SG]|uniref:hypothetical protein n=1 Tax=Sphingomonas sp. 2SG TaxID=2502201 RepID=UPI0010FA3A2A|nr:hypothetical protein [Sphingomonas sp. 2SG]
MRAIQTLGNAGDCIVNTGTIALGDDNEGIHNRGLKGNVLLGSFKFDTVGVNGGMFSVASGQTLATSGPIALTGSNASETVANDPTILGPVKLDGGNDVFIEGVGSSGDDLNFFWRAPTLRR